MQKQTKPEEHMQNTASVSQLSLFKASEPPAVEQVFKKPRAKPANTFSADEQAEMQTAGRTLKVLP